MANAWIEHVKSYCQKKGMKYNDALKSAECKAAYKSGAGTKKGMARVGQPKGARLAYDDLPDSKYFRIKKKGKGIIDEMGQQQARIAYGTNELGLGANAGSHRSL